MTTSPTADQPELLPVLQADRDAAADWCRAQPFPSKQAEAPIIQSGAYDHHSLVQAFARHRLTSTTPTLGDMVMVPREPTQVMVDNAFDLETREDVRRRIWSLMLSAAPASPIPTSVNGAGVRELSVGLGVEVSLDAAKRVDAFLTTLFPEWDADQRQHIALECATAALSPALDNTAVEGLRALVQEMLDNLKQYSLDSGCCHCGDSMDRHAEPMVCGHTPVDMGWAAAEAWIGKAEAALVGGEYAK